MIIKKLIIIKMNRSNNHWTTLNLPVNYFVTSRLSSEFSSNTEGISQSRDSVSMTIFRKASAGYTAAGYTFCDSFSFKTLQVNYYQGSWKSFKAQTAYPIIKFLAEKCRRSKDKVWTKWLWRDSYSPTHEQDFRLSRHEETRQCVSVQPWRPLLRIT